MPFEGGLRARDVVEGEEVPQRLGARLPRHPLVLENRLDLGAEAEALRVPLKKQRLDAEAVAAEHEPLPGAVPDGDGEHAVELGEHVRADLFVEVKQDLRIGARSEDVAFLAKAVLRLELREVVHLAVVDDVHARVFVGHRHVPVLGQVDHGESTGAEARAALHERAAVTGPAVGQRVGHALEERSLRLLQLAFECDEAADSTHGQRSS